MKGSNMILILAEVHLEFGVYVTTCVPARACCQLSIGEDNRELAQLTSVNNWMRADIVPDKCAISNLFLCTESLVLLFQM